MNEITPDFLTATEKAMIHGDIQAMTADAQIKTTISYIPRLVNPAPTSLTGELTAFGSAVSNINSLRRSPSLQEVRISGGAITTTDTFFLVSKTDLDDLSVTPTVGSVVVVGSDRFTILNVKTALAGSHYLIQVRGL